MLMLICEIAVLVTGLTAVVTGKLRITTNRDVRGPAARVLGLVGMVPLPASFAIGFVIGMSVAPGEFQAISGWLWAVELAILIGCVVLMYGIGFFSAKVTEAPVPVDGAA